MTPGWPVKPGALATKPTTFTTRTTLSSPTRASTAASALSAQARASSLACSGVTGPPTRPVCAITPPTIGSWPAVNTRSPVRTAGT